MKRGFAILVSLVILISGMNLSFAVHSCGGKVVASKISFTGSTATCGMAEDQVADPTDLLIKSGCCQNRISYLEVDNFDNAPASLKTVNALGIQILFKDVFCSLEQPQIPIARFPNGSPPGSYMASSVQLSSICVFRI